MSATSILTCNCKAADQDKMYGTGKRVHNWGQKSSKWCCTVCANQKEGPAAAKKDKASAPTGKVAEAKVAAAKAETAAAKPSKKG